jgi:hypothetical protein
MVVAATAAVTMLVMVIMIVVVIVLMLMMPMGVIVMMLVAMGMMVMIMAVVMPVMMMVVVADMGAALRPERALHGGHGAALPARQLGKSRIVLDIESIVRDLGEAVVAAEMPGEAHEAKRIFRLHLQQFFGLRLHLNEASILQAQGITVVDGGLHVEIEQDLGAALTFQRGLPAVSRLMVEGHRVDDTVGLHGGLADDGGDAGHGFVSGQGWISDR